MEIYWFALLRALHIAGAVLWLGGALFGTFVIAPNVAASGPSGAAFMGTVQRSGRLGRYMGTAAVTTLASGIVLYVEAGYLDVPFATRSNALLTAGAVMALAAWLFAIAMMGIDRRRIDALQAASPPKALDAGIQDRIAAIQGAAFRRGRYVLVAVVSAFLLMVGRNVVL